MPPPGARWRPPTLADHLGLDPATVLRCPGCRRRVRAQEVRDLRPLPALGQDFGCDGCTSRLERAGTLDPLAYVTAAGAPANVRAHLTAKDARRRRRLGLPAR